ncbi:hypothetical protein DSO57_1023887 [Entomophthora muscae]|uniref:Uncharacterized protein n=1 Tax=Entomophthora muscae TaxID=34485 RepID=A0ACC2TQC9_9FUNG|nr:hypothetical protein DSO57_1023887 [Entomophthora muscae]
MDKIAVLKSFLVQHTLGCPPLTCYNCQQFGHIAINCTVKQCGYCGVENKNTSAWCPARLACVKPKVVDSMPMELMAVEKCVSTPPIYPKCIRVAEPSPTCTLNPSYWTKAGIRRENAPSPEDFNKSKKHLKLFEDAIQTLLDKLFTLSEELDDEQHQEIEARIGKHTPEDVVVEGEDILSCKQQLDIEFEEDKLQPTQEPLPINPMTGVTTPMVVVKTVPESCDISSKVSPLPEGVLFTPVKQKVF